MANRTVNTLLTNAQRNKIIALHYIECVKCMTLGAGDGTSKLHVEHVTMVSLSLCGMEYVAPKVCDATIIFYVKLVMRVMLAAAAHFNKNFTNKVWCSQFRKHVNYSPFF